MPWLGYLTLGRPQTALVLSLSTLVVAFAARSRELAERALVASLHTTARFSELRQAAQLAALRAKSQREAADARTNAFQNVMRYVCHELRNPLHGIMVRRGVGASARQRGTHTGFVDCVA